MKLLVLTWSQLVELSVNSDDTASYKPCAFHEGIWGVVSTAALICSIGCQMELIDQLHTVATLP